jgi:hypothetical protein
VVVPQRRVPARFLQRLDARLRAVDLGHHDRAVEQVARRALQCQQGVEQAQDRKPVGVGVTVGCAMQKRDACFETNAET